MHRVHNHKIRSAAEKSNRFFRDLRRKTGYSPVTSMKMPFRYYESFRLRVDSNRNSIPIVLQGARDNARATTPSYTQFKNTLWPESTHERIEHNPVCDAHIARVHERCTNPLRSGKVIQFGLEEKVFAGKLHRTFDIAQFTPNCKGH